METIQILLIIASAILSIGWYGFRKMCPNCHSWNGLKKINSDHERTDTRYRTETKKITKRDKHGNIIGSTEKQESVPYTVSFYKVTYRCKSCNQEIQRTMRNGKYAKEAGIVFIISLIILFSAFSPNKNNLVNDNRNVISNQSNTVDTISNYSKANVAKANDYATKKASNDDKKNENSDLSSKSSLNKEVKSENTESKQKELENEIPDEKPNNIQVISKKTVITVESPEYLKRELAIEMLKRGKDVGEIADSTYLSKGQIRKLRRNIEK